MSYCLFYQLPPPTYVLIVLWYMRADAIGRTYEIRVARETRTYKHFPFGRARLTFSFLTLKRDFPGSARSSVRQVHPVSRAHQQSRVYGRPSDLVTRPGPTVVYTSCNNTLDGMFNIPVQLISTPVAASRTRTPTYVLIRFTAGAPWNHPEKRYADPDTITAVTVVVRPC